MALLLSTGGTPRLLEYSEKSVRRGKTLIGACFRKCDTSRSQLERLLSATIAAVMLGCAATSQTPPPGSPQEIPPSERVLQAAGAGELRYRVTLPDEVRALVGTPPHESSERDGGTELTHFEYLGVSITFGRPADEGGMATLRRVEVGGIEHDIGATSVVVLRDAEELFRLDAFTGLQGMSLANVDLRTSGERLDVLSFDTRTVWPSSERLPAGFDPKAVLEDGRNPGLGIRRLHGRGVDGRGVGLAIIDQPLLLDHEEYRAQLAHYEAIDVDDAPPQFHAPRVASIAVGRSLGVAPGAQLSFYAVPMWSFDSAQYATVLDRIVERNRNPSRGDQIRVVSVSSGMFPRLRGIEAWREAKKRAEQAGIIVITCDPEDLRYGIVGIKHGADADDAQNYERSRYAEDSDLLLVPGARRTLASERGPDVYQYDPRGGMSWGAPWIAGLAALGFQVAPCATPEQIARVLVETATPTSQGPVASPTAFVDVLEQACSRP